MNERALPAHIDGYGAITPYRPGSCDDHVISKTPVRMQCVTSGQEKLLADLRSAIEQCGIADGACLSFHHHLRDGDKVLNLVLEEAAKLGLRNLHIAASSLFPVHAPLVEHIRNGVVTRLTTSYMVGPVAAAVSEGLLANPVVLQTHGGRARAIEAGDLHIDAAFIAAPAADVYGNISGVDGPAACGVLGYAAADAAYADRVVAVTAA